VVVGEIEDNQGRVGVGGQRSELLATIQVSQASQSVKVKLKMEHGKGRKEGKYLAEVGVLGGEALGERKCAIGVGGGIKHLPAVRQQPWLLQKLCHSSGTLCYAAAGAGAAAHRFPLLSQSHESQIEQIEQTDSYDLFGQRSLKLQL